MYNYPLEESIVDLRQFSNPPAMCDILARLHSWSLLQSNIRDKDGRQVFSLLATTRHFANQKLEPSLKEQTYLRLFQWLLQVVPSDRLESKDEIDNNTIAKLGSELPNILSALQFLHDKHPQNSALLVLLAFRLLGFRGLQQQALDPINLIWAQRDFIDCPTQARLLVCRSNTLRVMSRHKEAHADAIRALDIKQNEPEITMQAHQSLGSSRLEMGLLKDAEESLLLAESLAVEHQWMATALKTWINLGNIMLLTHRYEKASSFFQRAIKAASELDDQLLLGHCLLNQGSLQLHRGYLDQALLYLKRTVSVARSSGDQRVAALAEGNLATVYCEMGELPEAISHAEIAVTGMKACGDLHNISAVQLCRAQIAQQQGHLDEAAVHCSEVLHDLAEHHRRYRALAHVLMAAICHERGWLHEALDHNEEANKAPEISQNHDSGIMVLSRIASAWAQMGAFDRAEGCITEAEMKVTDNTRAQIMVELGLHKQGIAYLKAKLENAGQAHELEQSLTRGLSGASDPKVGLRAPSAAAWSTDIRFAQRIWRNLLHKHRRLR